MKWPARRMATQANKSFGMYEAAARLEAEGADIIHLEVGRPSEDTPVHIKEAAKQALDDGIVHYGDLQGTGTLRKALADKLRRDNCLTFGADEILITTGLTQASFAAFMAGIDHGDEVIVLDPYYPQHNSKIALVGGQVVTVRMSAGNGFRPDPAVLEAAITERSKMLVLINPGNPAGTVLTREELEAIADIATRHDLIVLSDEVYELIVYDDHEHISIASLPGMSERTITLGAFTKAYSMDGWRMGYAAAKPEFIEQMQLVTLNSTTHPCVFAQEGALAAIVGPQEPMLAMVAEDRRRRDLTVERLNAMPGISCRSPQGGIYAFPDFSSLSMSSEALVTGILEEAHVALESGSFYGESGQGHLRVCFGSEPYARVAEAMDRLERYVSRFASARKTS